MKIAGQVKFERATKAVTLPRPGRPLVLTIRALPLGFEQQIADKLPAPRPPGKYAMKGGKVLRGVDGRSVWEEDARDPEYLTRMRHLVALQGVAILHEALGADPSVSFETDRSLPTEQFYEGIEKELREAQFTSGDMRILLDEVFGLSNMKGEAIEAAKEGFSSAGEKGEESEAAGNSPVGPVGQSGT